MCFRLLNFTPLKKMTSVFGNGMLYFVQNKNDTLIVIFPSRALPPLFNNSTLRFITRDTNHTQLNNRRSPNSFSFP